jgi:hypothetical protein
MDRELLELAAKAAGIAIKFQYTHGVKDLDVPPRRTDTWENWNPLIDDGDALRLAVKTGVDVSKAQLEYYDRNSKDPYDATRRAIVRAAAEIGRRLK